MRQDILLTRDAFREGVFARDNNKCVICGEPAKDAHHILERRLFSEPHELGGYFLANGASLCEKHHIMAEETTLSCEEIRAAAGIDHIVLPDHLYGDYDYDKWGNIMLKSGRRLKGDLYYDESVQKILKQGGFGEETFSNHVKYPRTYHLPWSHLGKDDRKQAEGTMDGLQVVGTLKLDGENTTMYNDHIHARSLDSETDDTRKWVKGLWSQIHWQISPEMRICGENLYAVHTMRYNDLKSYFYIFSVWHRNMCLSWEETEFYAAVLEIPVVPVFYRGPFDPEAIQKAFEPFAANHEGYTVRNVEAFPYGAFRRNMGKYVRPEFKQALNNAHGHWRSKKIETNQLSNE